MNTSVGEIIAAIEEFAHPEWQEDFDNTGWQIQLEGVEHEECTGVMLCVDATPTIVDEAAGKGCNLLLTHHPLLFRGVKRIDAGNRVGRTIIRAIEKGVSIYSCHTSVDSAPCGVSHKLAEKLGLKDVEILSSGRFEGVGLGVVGNLALPIEADELPGYIKQRLGSPVARCSGFDTIKGKVERIAVGGGACADLIPEAISKGAQVMVTSDVKHNYFLDYEHAIAVVDLGHYETEECTKDIFYSIIREKFPNFVPYYSQTEKNPIKYI